MYFLFNRTTLQVFVTYRTGALYVHPLWFYKRQHDNRVSSTQYAFSLPFAAILVNCAPSGEMPNYCTPHIIKENFENFLIHRCNYILLSQVYCVWQVVKPPTIILNNPVLFSRICLSLKNRRFRSVSLTNNAYISDVSHACSQRVVKTRVPIPFCCPRRMGIAAIAAAAEVNEHRMQICKHSTFQR